MLHLAWIVPLSLLIVFLYSPRFRGDIAESRVRRLLAAGLEKSRYTVFNDLVLAAGGGTRVIDHVVVSKFGIWVIESRYVRGWLSGAEFQGRWKRKSPWRSEQIDNPLHDNRVQVETLQRLLDYPAKVFFPVVVLVGHKGFRTHVPDNIVSPEKLLASVRRKTSQVLTPEQAEQAIQRIDQARLRSGARRRVTALAMLRPLLLLLLIAGAWLAFRVEIGEWVAAVRKQAEQRESPERFRADGSRKSEQEMWEDSLVCAFSVDTGRCACHGPGGEGVDLDPETCRRLAERGSILRQ